MADKDNKPTIPIERVLIMSALFGVAYFIFELNTHGFSWNGLGKSIAGTLIFGGFYFLFGRILRRYVK